MTINSISASKYTSIANTENIRNPGFTRPNVTADIGQINYANNPVWQEMLQTCNRVDFYLANCPELLNIIHLMTKNAIGDGYLVEIRPAAKYADNYTAQEMAKQARDAWADIEERLLRRDFHSQVMRNYYAYGAAYILPLQDFSTRQIEGIQILPSPSMEIRTGLLFVDPYISDKISPGDSVNKKDEFRDRTQPLPSEIKELAQLDPLSGRQLGAWRPEEIIMYLYKPVAGMLYGMPFCQPAFQAMANLVQIQASILEARAAARPQMVITAQGPNGTALDARRLADIYRQTPQGRFDEGLDPAYSMVLNGNISASMLAPPEGLFQFFTDYEIALRALTAAFVRDYDYTFKAGGTNVAVIETMAEDAANQARRDAEDYADKVLRKIFGMMCNLSGIDLRLLNFNVRINQGVTLTLSAERANFAKALLEQQLTSGIEIIPNSMLLDPIADYLGLDAEQLKSAKIMQQQAKQQSQVNQQVTQTPDNVSDMPDMPIE